MIRAIVVLLLAACATAPIPEPEVLTRPQPGLESAPTKPPLATFPLPERLAVDPTTLKSAPLELTIRAPERFELGNGVTVYLVEDHTTPLVLVRALLPAGTVEDPPDKLGLASVTMSLLAEGGAGPLGAEALDELLEYHAADLTSGASDEYSTVSLSVRSQDLTKLFPIFADVLQRPRFDVKRFEVVRARALESVRRREDRPDAVASRALNKAFFGPASPLAREPLESHLTALTPGDVKRFHANHFTPVGTRLVITGDFDPAAVKTLLGLHVKPWKGGPLAARIYGQGQAQTRRVILVPRQVAQVKIRLGGPGFPRKSSDEYRLRLANTALGSFGVGRLYREIRDERGLAYSAFSQVSPGPTTGLFLAGFDTRPDQAVEALKVGLRILEGAGAGEPFTLAELSTAVDMSLNAFAFRFDTAARIGFERALFDHFGYPDDYLERFRDRTAAVTLEEANQAVRRFSTGLQIVVVGPASLEPALRALGPVTLISDVDQFR
ncbi:MAG: insulinase family protein [Myxococcales bacterium]|nr:insulinase family protein [Myxococcales bacterium]